MWLILQQNRASDYIISTGRLHSVKDFVKIVFEKLALDYKNYVKVNQLFYRASEKTPLCGDSNKIRSLGWEETKNLKEIIQEMIEYEIKNL